MKERLRAWLSGELSGMEDFLKTEKAPDAGHEEQKLFDRHLDEELLHDPATLATIRERQLQFRYLYRLVAIVGCIVFIAVMLYMVARLPEFGADDPHATAVYRRYVESGLEETGAVNIVAGMILDYRAFDTLGESFVLFTALTCVTMLLRIDRKNMRRDREDYYTIRQDQYFDTSHDQILRVIGSVAVPCILLFGVYILLNGHLLPGGGFSGGAILGAGLIILSSALGFDTADRILTSRRLYLLSFIALAFYSLSKCYVFFIGANGIHNPIPKGTPGAILSSGLILPLNIAVGLVVACTMYGMYSLFRRGTIGNT